jgi:hypothetical protein
VAGMSQKPTLNRKIGAIFHLEIGPIGASIGVTSPIYSCLTISGGSHV